jgi:hypothetical protein
VRISHSINSTRSAGNGIQIRRTDGVRVATVDHGMVWIFSAGRAGRIA